MTVVNYNGINPFVNIAPTPFVGREEIPLFYKNRHCIVEKLTLEGKITGRCQTFAEMVSRKRAVIAAFSESFKSFSIEEDLNTIYNSPVTKVVGVNFGDSQLMSLIPFSIELECYPSGFHSGFFGVIEPSNEFAFAEDDDKIIALVHTSSARGIHTETADALTNAKNYVSSISGWSDQISPLFLSGVNDSLTLKTVQEKVDRFSATYSLVETYKYDSLDSNSGILRYSAELNSGAAEPTEVVLEGTVEGGHNVPLSTLRTRYPGINFFALAGTEYSGFCTGVLNPYPAKFEFTEDPQKKNIKFSVTYNDDPYPNPYMIDRATIKKSKTGGNSLAIEGRVKWRGNCICNNEFGISQIKNFINNYDFYAHAVRKWEQYGLKGIPNPNPVSKSFTQNKNACEYRIQLEYEEQVNTDLPDELENFEYNLSVQPAIPLYSFTPVICEGEYVITRLKYDRRAKFAIDGSAVIKECANYDIGLSLIKSEINRLASIYVVGTRKVLESLRITEGTGDNPRVISFSASWSSESPRAFNIIYDSAT